MQLRYISIAALIAQAGGDPWAINDSLRSGQPAQISNLAEAFHGAGRCTQESSAAFEQARGRFDAAWNHHNGDHPINGSAEVQRVTKALGAQSLQLPKIAVDLENIAAALAEAQKAGAGQIAALEGRLRALDDLIGQAVQMEKNPDLTAEDRAALDAFIRTCEDDAIADTKSALAQLRSTRDGYAATLRKSMATLRTDGYDPPATLEDWAEGPLKPGEARDLGPVAGTGSTPGIPGIGAADLGEVVQLPDGSYVAIFGDSFAGDKMGDGTHYPSVAVPVTFDQDGRPHFGEPLTGPDGSPNVLFPPPPQAAGKNTLPAGSIRMRDGTTYMMATGTTKLNPDGGSWLVQVTNDPGQGWQPIRDSWRAPGAAPTQISGFQAATAPCTSPRTRSTAARASACTGSIPATSPTAPPGSPGPAPAGAPPANPPRRSAAPRSGSSVFARSAASRCCPASTREPETSRFASRTSPRNSSAAARR